MPINTSVSQDKLIDQAKQANADDFGDAIKNLCAIIDDLDDKVSEWKRDYDKVESELKEAQAQQI